MIQPVRTHIQRIRLDETKVNCSNIYTLNKSNLHFSFYFNEILVEQKKIKQQIKSNFSFFFHRVFVCIQKQPLKRVTKKMEK